MKNNILNMQYFFLRIHNYDYYCSNREILIGIQLTDGTRCSIASPSRHPTERANKKDKRKAFFFVPVILMKMAPRTEAKLRKTTQSVPNP